MPSKLGKLPPKADSPRVEKILIVGAGGGREHAIAWKIAQPARSEGGSLPKRELFFARGNAGTAELGTNLDIKETEISKLIEFAQKEKIDLTLALSDDPLALGIVDEFQTAGLRIWGPTKGAAELEWSKAYAKDFMNRHSIPTAKHQTFRDFLSAKTYIEKGKFPTVIKASGLALGKGVTVAQTIEDATEFLRKLFVDKIFGNSGTEVVIEEFLSGTEISIHAISDGKNWKMFPASQDHKRVYDDDAGENTGGMGVIAPLPFVDKKLLDRIEKDIIAPAITGMQKEGRPFTGILYPGIMLTDEGPKVFEFNARFGDPETETYMRLLDTDLLDIIKASIDGEVGDLELKWKKESACSIALASGGYPDKYEKGIEIIGIEKVKKEKDIIVFHAGTKIENRKLLTNGGRVLWVSATGKNLKAALEKAYSAIQKISFKGMHYRKDIGKKALEL